MRIGRKGFCLLNLKADSYDEEGEGEESGLYVAGSAETLLAFPSLAD